MNSIRNLLFHAVLLVILTSSSVFPMHGKEYTSVVRIVRNVPWNDFITQIEFSRNDSPQDSLDKEMLVIHRLFKAYEIEARVDIHDPEALKAIDQRRARLQQADSDLEILRDEVSFGEGQAKGER
jgi:hypothetical protein